MVSKEWHLILSKQQLTTPSNILCSFAKKNTTVTGIFLPWSVLHNSRTPATFVKFCSFSTFVFRCYVCLNGNQVLAIVPPPHMLYPQTRSNFGCSLNFGCYIRKQDSIYVITQSSRIISKPERRFWKRLRSF